MTAKGCRQKEWTTKEIEYLLENAGVIPLQDIAEELERSYKAVHEQWRKHKKPGETTRVFDTREICIYCYTKRHYMGIEKCIICAKKDELERSEERVSKALLDLSAKERANYRDQESKRESQAVAPPKRPNTKGMTEQQRRRAEFHYQKELEETEIATWQRRINANKTRLKRIRKKAGTNPRTKSATKK